MVKRDLKPLETELYAMTFRQQSRDSGISDSRQTGVE